MKVPDDVRRMSDDGWFNTAMNADTVQLHPKHLTVLAVGDVQLAEQGTEYLECETTLGPVAIWGSERSRWNIGLVQQEALPFEAVMFCVPGQDEAHTYWVLEETKLFFPAI
jgi:hypothetical protein